MGADPGILKQFCGLFLVYFTLICFDSEATMLPQDEVDSLRQIAKSLGKTNWDFGVDPCSGDSGWVTANAPKKSVNSVTCRCSANSTICHIASIVLKSQNLTGELPKELVKLPFLQELDLTRNFLSGTIPVEWASLELVHLSLAENRLSGPIPKEIGNITTLRSMSIEANQFSGAIPSELGNLKNLQRLSLSSNELTGELPTALAKLSNLTDLRINDNCFSGKIPDFIWSWTNLERLFIQGSSLKGPIPSGISSLRSLIDLRISDLVGTGSHFPLLSKMDSMRRLILRNCLISGNIPEYIGNMSKLSHLDLSFNNLTGNIPSSFQSLSKLDSMYLTSNKLSGALPEWIIRRRTTVDLSYNGFTWETSGPSKCQIGNVNLAAGVFSTVDNKSQIASCLMEPPYACPNPGYRNSLYINCGGKESTIDGRKYEEDVEPAGASTFFLSQNWAFSSTGNFMDDNTYYDNYIATNSSTLSMLNPELYTTARLSPLSLTYYGLYMENGNYILKLHFAEIMFTADKTFSSLGRRIFDVYIQGKLVLKDFNIENEAGGSGMAVVKSFSATVTSHTLEIRFYWAGKGTQGIPERGVYGPLISAISVDPDFDPFSYNGHKISIGVVVLILASVVCLILLVIGILWWKGWLVGKVRDHKGSMEIMLADVPLMSREEQ